MDQPGVVASPASGHLKERYYVGQTAPAAAESCLYACVQENCTGELYNCTRSLTAAAFHTAD